MTAKQLSTMINKIREYRELEDVSSLQDYVYDLATGLIEIGRRDLSNQLYNLCNEIGKVNDSEI